MTILAKLSVKTEESQGGKRLYHWSSLELYRHVSDNRVQDCPMNPDANSFSSCIFLVLQ